VRVVSAPNVRGCRRDLVRLRSRDDSRAVCRYGQRLNADLAGARANPNTDWIVAGGHRPFEDFNSSAHLALFKQYAVDLYVAGHGHSYLRYTAYQWGDGTAHIIGDLPDPALQFGALLGACHSVFLFIAIRSELSRVLFESRGYQHYCLLAVMIRVL
jgi:hypothetical protein